MEDGKMSTIEISLQSYEELLEIKHRSEVLRMVINNYRAFGENSLDNRTIIYQVMGWGRTDGLE